MPLIAVGKYHDITELNNQDKRLDGTASGSMGSGLLQRGGHPGRDPGAVEGPRLGAGRVQGRQFPGAHKKGTSTGDGRGERASERVVGRSS